jgi:hypothetical protein
MQYFKKQIRHKIANSAAYVINGRQSRIIYYHDFHNDESVKYYKYSTPISLFLEHVLIIEELGFEIVSTITKPHNQIMISLDDGYRGVFQFKNLFINKNIFIKIFIITSKIDELDFLSKDEIIKLNKCRNFTFGAHSHSHLPLNSLSTDSLTFELKESKNILSSIINEDIIDFAFPIGKFNKNIIEEALNAQLNNLYTTIPGKFFNSKSYIYRSLAQDLNNYQFENLLLGGYDIFKSYYKILSRKF